VRLLGRTEDRALIGALLGVVLLYCLTPVYSENLFWHMRNGEDILDSGTIRTVDTLTWTMTGRTWLQQEWLAEVAFASAWRLAGPLGLTVLKMLVVTGSAALAALAAARRGGRGAAIVLVAVLWFSVTQARWFERPHIFTGLFFSLYLFLLSGRPRPLWKDLLLFVPLQVIWVNTHAGFVMGPFLLAAPLLDIAAAGNWKRFAGRLALPVAALAACGIHPNGFASLSYLPGFISQPLFRDSIREWWSPFDPRYGTARTAFTLVALGALSMIAMVRRRKTGARLSEAALIAVLLASSLFAARNIELLALASIVVLPRLVGRVAWPVPAVLLAVAAAIPPLFGLPREFGPPRRFGPGMAWGIYPVGLADFVEQNSLYGRPFNTNEISGYLQYRFGERLPLYMDGRCLLYPQRFYAEYLLLAQSPDSTDAAGQLAVVRSRGFETAFFDWPRQRGSVANMLAELPDWTPVYWDSLTIAYASIPYLESTNSDSLAFEIVDPLSPEELLERPVYEVPARLLPEMRRASRMDAAGDIAALTGFCLALRSGDGQAAEEFRSAVKSVQLSEALAHAMAADTSASGASPQVTTILAWALAGSGRWVEAARVASEAGDGLLASSIGILAPASCGLTPSGPPPWVPEEVFGQYASGGMTAPESSAVEASALFAVGRGSEAVEKASLLGAQGVAARPWAVSAAALVLEASGEDPEAVALSDAALAASSNPFTLLSRGRIECMAGRYASAIPYLRRAAAMAPGAGSIRIDLASALWRTGSLEEAAVNYGDAGEYGAALPPSALARLGWAAVLSGTAVDSPAGAGQD
jgi:tetratricopeptide (TPR) repeat protein